MRSTIFQYHVEATTRAVDIAPIDASRILPAVMPTIEQVDNRIRLHFGEEEAASTISMLRTRSGYVEYTVRDLSSIPHDFVHAALSDIPQSRRIAGQTPDIVWDDESGATNIIEIATRHVQTYEKARAAITEKVNKYYHHVQEGRVQKMNIVVVYMQGVITLGDVLQPESVQALVQSYHLGLRVLEDIKATTTIQVSPDLESVEKEHLWFRSCKFPECPEDGRASRLMLNNRQRARISDCKDNFRLNFIDETLRSPFSGALNRWLHTIPGDKFDEDVVVHLPIMVECTHEDLSDLTEAPGYQPLMFLYMEGYVGDKDLRAWRDLSLDTRKQIRRLENKKVTRVHLTESDRIYLAERGVLKKSIMHMQVVQEADDQQSRSYSGRASVLDIAEFMKTPLRAAENEFISISDLEEFHIPDNTNFDPHQLIDVLLNTDLFRAISLFDLIVREVILSMRDNLDDDSKRGNFAFISKRIGNYNLVIRPTKFNQGSDSPIHFMLMSTTPFKPMHGIFEAVHKTSAVYHTKFVSLSRLRAEHYCNILPQCLALYLMTYDELGPGLSNADISLAMLNQVVEPAKCIITTLLEDKEYTSRNLQQMRYYYMELMATGRTFAEKIAEKLDSHCRSRLFLYFVNNILQDNGDQDVSSVAIAKEDESKEEMQPTNWAGSDNSSESDGSDEESAFLAGLKSNEPHVDIRSFIGSRHTTLQTLLIPMYLSVLHNKNEQEKTLSAKQIMNKLLKEEYALAQSKYCHGDDSHCPDLNAYKHHDWSIPIVKKAARLLREELLEFTQQDLHRHCMRTMYQSTMDELATTKASHSGICQERLKSKEDLSKVGVRNKCFVEVLKRGPYPSAKLVENVEFLRDRMVSENDSRVLVQMFKKNQIGGTREILILDFTSRCLIRILEDMSRALCEAHPYECLTKPFTKGNMTANHSYKVKQAGFRGHSLTWRASLDKTTWAQMFVNPLFYVILSEVLPEYADFIAFVLNCHSRKRMELPKALVESFYNSKKSNLKEYEVNKLREEFLGFSAPDVTDGQYMPYVNNASNMMQGILHYTSSLLHVAYSIMLRTMFEKVVRKSGNSLVFSAQVSSDDSGILATVLIHDHTQDLQALATTLDVSFQRCIVSLDKAFSVRTSLHKSTMTYRPLYEFNSAFYSGNNYTCPLIKYVARSCDDAPSESLRSRVINMHNSLRGVRENGGSGALCSAISVCQKITLFMNLGYGSMTFFREYIEPLRSYKLSHLGVFQSVGPLIAGIYGADYSDFHMCLEDTSCHHLLSVLHRRPVLGGKLLNDLSAHYRAWPVAKYKQVIGELGIEAGYGHKLTFQQLEFLFRQVMSWQDCNDRIKLSVSNQSIARSFTFLTRCESIFSSAYLLWDRIFSDGTNSLALDELILKAVAMEEEDGPAGLDKIFPNHVDLASVHSALECQVQVDVLQSRFIYRPHVYEPIHSGLHDMSLIKDVLAKKWYGMIVRPSRTTIDLAFSSLQSMLPWLDEDPDVTLAASGMSSPLELINYITMLSERVKPITLVSMGGTRRNRSVIENLALLNTFRNRLCLLRHPDDYQLNKEFGGLSSRTALTVRQFQNRFADWHQLISHFHGSWDKVDELVNSLNTDMKGLTIDNESDLRVSLGTPSERRTAAECLSLIDGGVWSEFITDNPDRSMESHVGELKMDQMNRQKGSCVIIKKIGLQRYMIKCKDGKALKVISNTQEIDEDLLRRSYPFIDLSTASKHFSQDVFYQVPNCIRYYRAKLWLCHESPKSTHYLTEVFQVYGTMLDPLPRTHLGTNALAKIWLSRSTNIYLLDKIINGDPTLIPDLTKIAENSQKMISTARVRGQFSKNKIEIMRKQEEKVLMDANAMLEDLLSGYEFEEGDFTPDDTKYIPEAYILSEYISLESDAFSMQFRSEPDIGYLAIHPLMSEIIRMINLKMLGTTGLQRIAADVALTEGIITQENYDFIFNAVSMEDLLSAL